MYLYSLNLSSLFSRNGRWDGIWEKNMKIARVYLTESDKRLNEIMKYLHSEAKVRGATVFRGISGFGNEGHMHSSTIMALSLNLPLVLEFFDKDEKVEEIIKHLETIVNRGYIISWSVE